MLSFSDSVLVRKLFADIAPVEDGARRKRFVLAVSEKLNLAVVLFG